MTKIFHVESCARCPNKIVIDTGAMPRLVTGCYAAGSRILPHTLYTGHGGIKYASPTGVIPDWCPLETLPTKVGIPA